MKLLAELRKRRRLGTADIYEGAVNMRVAERAGPLYLFRPVLPITCRPRACAAAVSRQKPSGIFRGTLCQLRTRLRTARWGSSFPTALAFVKEDLWMFMPPGRAVLAIFTDNDSQPHARATITLVATLT